MAGNSTYQVFQTSSTGRWQRFKWAARFVFFLLVLGIAVIIITLSRTNIPDLPHFANAQEKQVLLDTNSSWLNKKSKILKQYDGFRKYITEKVAYKSGGYPIPKRFKKKNGVVVQADSSFYSLKKFAAGIRAGFYVNWDSLSFISLQQNISHLNMVIPEWFFIDPNTDTLRTDIDKKALDVMLRAGVKIVPLLTNNIKGIFRGDVLHQIFTDKKKKERLINDIINVLKKDSLDGINIDFEELKESKNETLVLFQKELYEKLHARGFLVTQDIEPFNDDYNLTELGKYNDYVCLMAYDQSSESTAPGPICHQKWIEAAVDQAARKIPPGKMILAIAGFGYDWQLNADEKPIPELTKPVSYQEALSLATSFDAQNDIDFDNDSYNLHFAYGGDKGEDHEVHFTDAATTFNSMRFAVEYGLSGVSLWKLGSEDPRMWDFYDRDMSKDSIKHFDFSNFSIIRSLNKGEVPAYHGEGEVLDIVGGPLSGKITPEVDTSELLISEEEYDSLPSKWIARKYGTKDKKKLVLTFDDGPDPKYTPQILDILSREKVPAAFFVVGINAENNIPLVKRIYREGHEIGDHTFTHPNIAKVSRKRAVLEMESTRLLIECITGHSTILFRAPYNADFEPQTAEELIPVAIARQLNYLDIGESIDPLDWEPGTPVDSIVARVIRRKQDMTNQNLSGNIILLHDAGGDSRAATVAALPQIIHYFKARGYTFTTIADLLGKKKDDLMPPVAKGSGYFLLQINYYLAEFGYWGGNILSSVFIVFIILSVGRIIILGVIATDEYFREKKNPLEPFIFPTAQSAPLVSIIVPAYNEEVNAVSSLNNLLRTDYPNFEIIFVDDGSKDNTVNKVNDAFKNNNKVKVFAKINGGKASALNYGIAHSNAAYVICIDADTKLLPDAVSKLMMHFRFSNVGAVAGNVKVGNQVNLLTKWQAIEYVSSQNFDRRAFASLNAITVVPGAIGAFTKKALEDAGGFTTDTLAEDCDLTIRIIRCGYIVANETKAIALTESPETLKMFFKQRFRWNYGVMQTFWKNRDALFNWKYKWLGWAALPNILIFQFIIPSIIPLVDFFLLVGLLTGNAGTGNSEKILLYYLAFMVVDAAVALLAFSFEKENKWKLLWIIPQRLVWRWLTWIVLFKSIRRAFKGELQHWGVLKRTGNVKDITPVRA
jgi:peptidoglycan-N-acetylglucosamine deacetylase